VVLSLGRSKHVFSECCSYAVINQACR
jgi:hypothetical protein